MSQLVIHLRGQKLRQIVHLFYTLVELFSLINHAELPTAFQRGGKTYLKVGRAFASLRL